MFYIKVYPYEFTTEISDLVRAFLPANMVRATDSCIMLGKNDYMLECKYIYRLREVIAISELKMDGNIVHADMQRTRTDASFKKRRLSIKNALKRSVYNILEQITGKDLDWGILTGIRPTKIVHQMLDEGENRECILKILKDDYLVSSEKAHLLTRTAYIQRPILKDNDDKKISIYINIPFCTTKCLYCSFPSDTIDSCRDNVDSYIQALIYELEMVIGSLKKEGYNIQSLYIGGGTPTSISSKQLGILLEAIDHIIDVECLEEYTIEGGRPDSMDMDKLSIMKRYGVGRISINPQTMNEHTLLKIGRAHTAKDILDCFQMARAVGFKSINMDVIVGLPGEGKEDIYSTMSEICRLKPENITVHTLAIKRASRLKEHMNDYSLIDSEMADDMLNICYDLLNSNGYIPYYLYRQKYMLGNAENVGYGLPGNECIYNIQMMEEKQSIVAFGANGITKLYFRDQNRIMRVPNVKNINQYISRIDEMIKRKTEGMLTF